jgi:PAS domain S-box-containing protein
VQESPVVVFRWQAVENWPVVYVSENVNQFGYSSEDLLSGKISFPAIIHPDDLARVTEEVIEYSRQGIMDFKQEYRLITKSGNIRWVDDRTVIERNADGTITHYQGVVLDITERKAAQEEINKRQLFLESVLYHAPDAIIALDVLHRVVDWNQGAEKIFGFTCEEALGQELDSLVSRDKARVEADQKTRRVLSGKRVEAFETVRYKKDGTPVHVIAGGSPIMIDGTLTGVVAMYTDVTLLKQARDDARRNERRLRRIIDIVPSMIFVKNVQGRFLIANQAVADSYGMTVEALHRSRGCRTHESIPL